MPLEKVTPARMPRLAMILIMAGGATRYPSGEFRKLTASLLTPTINPETARKARIMMAAKKISIGYPF
jgi:hypothetical protein